MSAPAGYVYIFASAKVNHLSHEGAALSPICGQRAQKWAVDHSGDYPGTHLCHRCAALAGVA